MIDEERTFSPVSNRSAVRCSFFMKQWRLSRESTVKSTCRLLEGSCTYSHPAVEWELPNFLSLLSTLSQSQLHITSHDSFHYTQRTIYHLAFSNLLNSIIQPPSVHRRLSTINLSLILMILVILYQSFSSSSHCSTIHSFARRSLDHNSYWLLVMIRTSGFTPLHPRHTTWH